ncbi:anthranilate synthase component I family protein [Microbacterium sp. ZW T5_56]|uniref:anthranilate synthase component I family protein n=1 Tax=Microbacterium sp. ZW T5_56 TaxID=3378081 RepID=UPI0038544435
MTQPWIDPEAAFADLASDQADLFWLDAGPDAASGRSVLGRGVPVTWDEVARTQIDVDVASDVPAWVGALDYESGARWAGVPNVVAEQGPLWLRVTDAVIFDHEHRTMRFHGGADFRARVLSALPVASAPEAESVGMAQARTTPERYANLVAQCRESIRLGDAYQLCLTTRFDVPGHHDAVAVHRRLRRAAASHHGGFLRVGETSLVSISPEKFLGVDAGVITTRPIKGTRPRGVDADHDARLAAELHASEKERAENVMIVDLMRNDLSRVCQTGSVRVSGLWEIESYPTVHQLVSTVQGRLRPELTVGEVLAAVFPAGSMTGAPKLSAMTILAGLERQPRGMYAGCFGWIGANGSLELAMTIRTVVVGPASASVGAGGGITWGSIIADEVAEVGIKARTPLAALGAALPAGW